MRDHIFLVGPWGVMPSGMPRRGSLGDRVLGCEAAEPGPLGAKSTGSVFGNPHLTVGRKHLYVAPSQR